LKSHEKIYRSDVIDFINEFRIFIANYKIYAILEVTKYVLDKQNTNINPTDEFIQHLLKINKLKYIVVDVAFDGYQWYIVEANPPFSLSSYDMDIELYYRYCTDAWNWLTTVNY
jgi:hypothetical protein